MAHQVSGDELRTAVVRILDAWTARPPADHVKFPRVHGYALGVIDACGDFLALIDAQPALSFTEQEADRNARAGRPCCHATGPNHHPACTTNRTEQQQ